MEIPISFLLFMMVITSRQNGGYTDPKRSADEYLVWLTQLMALNNFAVDELSDMIIANVVQKCSQN